MDLVEENYLSGMPIESLYTYAMTKRMLYGGLLALRKQFGLRYLHLVPSTLYGPGYHTDGRQMHFIFDLIRKIMRGKERNEPVVLWGDGYQRRELVYVLDFVNAMVALSDRCDNEIINIGTGEEFTIRHFAKRICDRIGFDANAIEYDTSKYVGAVSKCLNIDKFRSLMPDRKVTPLEEGLDRTIGWFAENSDKYFP
jgi:GDP-L-fucose synthase